MKVPFDFDLQLALAGEPVRTLDGRKVSHLHYFKESTDDEKLYGIVDDGEELTVTSWSDAGRYYSHDENSMWDLFMGQPEAK